MTSNIYDMADTWNDAGTTFTAIKMNVTDTASNAASLLIDLQTGGTSRFSVVKNGRVNVGDINCAGDLLIYRNSLATVRISTAYTAFSLGLALGSSSNPSSPDVFLLRDGAANILGMRNGVNAQTVRTYNTYTDASNYERLSIGWSGNVMTIGTEAAGTGTQRNIVLNGANRAAYSETAADIAAALVAHGIMAAA